MERIRRTLLAARHVISLREGLRGLPRNVRSFYLRAWVWALIHDDPGALIGAASPNQTAALLRLGAERNHVVELGTGKAWTAIALALAAPERRIISYDPNVWPNRHRYLELVPPSVNSRIELRTGPAEQGAASGDSRVQFLFVDASHELDETLASFRAWESSLADDAVVAFHDYTNPEFPGVAAAVERLGLQGETQLGMFIWRCNSRA